MSAFTLPSGRIVDLRDPEDITWGEELHAISEGLRNAEEYTYAKHAALVPTLSRLEIAKLNRKDGRALSAEVDRLWNGRERSEAENLPLGNGSLPSSTDSSHANATGSPSAP